MTLRTGPGFRRVWVAAFVGCGAERAREMVDGPVALGCRPIRAREVPLPVITRRLAMFLVLGPVVAAPMLLHGTGAHAAHAHAAALPPVTNPATVVSLPAAGRVAVSDSGEAAGHVTVPGPASGVPMPAADQVAVPVPMPEHAVPVPAPEQDGHHGKRRKAVQRADERAAFSRDRAWAALRGARHATDRA